MQFPRIIDFRGAVAVADTPIEPAKVVAGHPLTCTDNRYSDASGQFHCGVWSSSPGTWRVHYQEHEFCCLLEGHIRLTGDDGSMREFSAGDAFVIPAGFAGTWETVQATRKYYALYEPTSDSSAATS